MTCIVRIILLFAFLLSCSDSLSSQEKSVNFNPDVVHGSLLETNNKRRVFLLVSRSLVVDSRGFAKSIIAEAYKTDSKSPVRHLLAYNTIAKKLNSYMKKHRSITAVDNIAEADFIIFFNLLEYRRLNGYPYPYGELFVIINDTSGARQPRIIWKQHKKLLWAEDAIKSLIKELRIARGEK